MTHTIRLIKDHREILLETLAQSMEIKEGRLRNPDSLRKMEQQYYDAALKIFNGSIDCGRPGVKNATDNLFAWIIDQIRHSGRLYDHELGKFAIDICRAAGEGLDQYQQFHNPLPRLFDLEQVNTQ